MLLFSFLFFFLLFNRIMFSTAIKGLFPRDGDTQGSDNALDGADSNDDDDIVPNCLVFPQAVGGSSFYAPIPKLNDLSLHWLKEQYILPDFEYARIKEAIMQGAVVDTKSLNFNLMRPCISKRSARRRRCLSVAVMVTTTRRKPCSSCARGRGFAP